MCTAFIRPRAQSGIARWPAIQSSEADTVQLMPARAVTGKNVQRFGTMDIKNSQKCGNLSAWKAVVRGSSDLEKHERGSDYQRKRKHISLTSTLTVQFDLDLFSSSSCLQMHLLVKF